jgi:3-methyladenine DNA glycosylase AlkD
MVKNPIHQQILKTISAYKSKSDKAKLDWVQKYLGSNKIHQGMTSTEAKKIASQIVKENNFDEKSLVDLLDSLYENGKTFTELNLAAVILGKLHKLRQNLDLSHLDHWLNYTCGWAENDVLCQSNFEAQEVLGRFSEWHKLLKQFVIDKNISKRRASMVLLVKSLRQSDDPRLSKLAFEQVEKLKAEKEVLITKAISWILRALVVFHKDEVRKYLEKNKDSLPKIAYRETLSKIETGRKYTKA